MGCGIILGMGSSCRIGMFLLVTSGEEQLAVVA